MGGCVRLSERQGVVRFNRDFVEITIRIHPVDTGEIQCYSLVEDQDGQLEWMWDLTVPAWWSRADLVIAIIRKLCASTVITE